MPGLVSYIFWDGEDKALKWLANLNIVPKQKTITRKSSKSARIRYFNVAHFGSWSEQTEGSIHHEFKKINFIVDPNYGKKL